MLISPYYIRQACDVIRMTYLIYPNERVLNYPVNQNQCFDLRELPIDSNNEWNNFFKWLDENVVCFHPVYDLFKRREYLINKYPEKHKVDDEIWHNEVFPISSTIIKDWATMLVTHLHFCRNYTFDNAVNHIVQIILLHLGFEPDLEKFEQLEKEYEKWVVRLTPNVTQPNSKTFKCSHYELQTYQTNGQILIDENMYALPNDIFVCQKNKKLLQDLKIRRYLTMGKEHPNNDEFDYRYDILTPYWKDMLENIVAEKQT